MLTQLEMPFQQLPPPIAWAGFAPPVMCGNLLDCYEPAGAVLMTASSQYRQNLTGSFVQNIKILARAGIMEYAYSSYLWIAIYLGSKQLLERVQQLRRNICQRKPAGFDISILRGDLTVL